jgi:hypothetical protein
LNITHLLQRARRDHGDPRFQRLAERSVSHLYNLRQRIPGFAVSRIDQIVRTGPW